jgi:hypothetical protein
METDWGAIARHHRQFQKDQIISPRTEEIQGGKKGVYFLMNDTLR